MDEYEFFLQVFPPIMLISRVTVFGVGGCTKLWCSFTDHVLQQWAASHGYTLLEASRRCLFRGPFFLTTSNSQSVFRITIRDATGSIHRGWLRYGGWWLGPLSGQIEVR